MDLSNKMAVVISSILQRISENPKVLSGIGVVLSIGSIGISALVIGSFQITVLFSFVLFGFLLYYITYERDSNVVNGEVPVRALIILGCWIVILPILVLSYYDFPVYRPQ
ncbi:MAG: hypothetical protein ABEI86_05965, partial [Halobacteriaceae archaeon]